MCSLHWPQFSYDGCVSTSVILLSSNQLSFYSFDQYYSQYFYLILFFLGQVSLNLMQESILQNAASSFLANIIITYFSIFTNFFS